MNSAQIDRFRVLVSRHEATIWRSLKIAVLGCAIAVFVAYRQDDNPLSGKALARKFPVGASRIEVEKTLNREQWDYRFQAAARAYTAFSRERTDNFRYGGIMGSRITPALMIRLDGQDRVREVNASSIGFGWSMKPTDLTGNSLSLR